MTHNRIRSQLAKAAALIALTAAAAGCASAPSLESHTTVVGQFDNASGMYVGNAVSILGVRIGSVEAIDQRGDHVDITMRIDGSIPVPADALAATVTDSVLTDRHIEFTPGYTGGPRLEDGAVLDRSRTRTPVEFDSALAVVDKLSTSLGGDGRGNGPISDVLSVGAAAAQGNNDGLRSALGALSDALRMGDDPEATREAITSIVSNLDSLTTAAAENDQTIREFGSDLGSMVGLLDDLDLGTGDTGRQLNEILQKTAEILATNRAAIGTTVSSTSTITDTMVQYNSQIGEFLDVFPLAANNFYNMVDPNYQALKAHANIDQILFDTQMLKEVCNQLKLTQLGCATGKMSDMGPDFGVTAMLAGMAGVGE